MKRMMRRVLGGVIALLVSTAVLGGTAGAHVLTVENRGNGEAKEFWVGAGSAAHGTGLVSACEAHRDHGHGAATIHTPWNPEEDCTHGGPPPPE